ncbi:sigma-70 family RNA polymerase sigma factor [Halobacillus litoralis]|uniref:sigma-70 family RNA polymerase sigma factor n=1 Tax=Halobacillus litoralis TaxID=45668 RepID=UPI001CD6A52E|nr:sigma-70 family RNA polymerase sigma factor [Halobacillus litoralis]MCA0972567.1 sigma-70 family RNA polymerase sigma factor [Halobacillus litoralis]
MIHRQQSTPVDQESSNDMNQRVEQWITDYGHDLKWLAYSYVKDHSLAEDITQETFIKAYQKFSTFKEQSSVKTWLYKITINLCKDYLKSSYMKRVVKKGAELFRSLPSSQSTPEEYILSLSEDEELLDHIMRLESKYREVIILYYFEEFDTKELAEVIQTSTNTVKTRLRRARQLLQKQMTSEGGSRT